MAWPYIAESNFEQGTNAEWSAESDTGSLLDFPHYSQLATQHNWSSAAPFKGAYCMRVNAGDTNSHFVNRTDAIVAIASSGFFRFQFCVGADWVTAGTTNTFTIFRLMGVATTTTILSVGLRAGRLSNTSLELAVGSSVPTVFDTANLDLNRWYTIEVQHSSAADITTGGGGTQIVYLDGSQRISVTTATTIQTVAATVARLGIMEPVAANQGALLFDMYAHDDLRLGPVYENTDGTWTMTKSGHLFVGPGTLENASLLAQAVTTGQALFYDTNQAGIMSDSKLKAQINAITASDSVDLPGVPIEFTRGCYVSLLPTAIASQPRLTATYRAAAEKSLSNKRQQGSRLKFSSKDAI